MKKNNQKLIVSLTTIPSRLELLPKVIDSIKKQTIWGEVSWLEINVDSNVPIETQKRYEALEDSKTRVMYRDPKWRSANKLIHTYKENPDAIIITVDDDREYFPDALESLLNVHYRHPTAIVSMEVNPVTRTDRYIQFHNTVDLKFGQIQYGKYLSNCCLFPSGCFSESLYDYDKFLYVTEATHDEFWFWINSTLTGTPCIGLNKTFSFALDGCDFDGKDKLTDKNAKPDVIKGYNDRMNEIYGEGLNMILDNHQVVFNLDENNVQAFYLLLPFINSLFSGFNVKVVFGKGLYPSWKRIIERNAEKLSWFRIDFV